MKYRLVAAAGSLAVAGSLLAMAPASAGNTWGSAQEISSKLGRAIAVSDDGRVAAWIRTNSSSGSGSVRTAWYRSAKKGWTPSAPIPGTAVTSALTMSKDGNYVFSETDGTGYYFAARSTKNTWSTATLIIPGTYLSAGRMSDNASTFAWVDWGPGPHSYPYSPGTLKTMSRNADGTFNPPVAVGTVMGDAFDSDSEYSPVWLSGDGSTLLWVDETYALKGSIKAADGTWAPPTLLKQYTNDPEIRGLQMSTNGTRVAWYQWDVDGLLNLSRSGTTWAPIDYITSDSVEGAGISPNGNVAAFCNEDGQMNVRKWDGAAWTRVKVLGSCGTPSVVVRNKTVAWTYSKYSGSSLRVSLYYKSKWNSAQKVSSTAWSPALNTSGNTLAWGSTGNKRIYSVKR